MRVEAGVGGEELLRELVVVDRAPEDQELQIGEGLHDVRLRLEVHSRRIGRDVAGL
jgi:hypothetical protein